MEMNEMVTMFTNAGVTAVVLGYFIIRDWKFMSTLSDTLTTLVNTVTSLKEVIQTVNLAHKRDED